jgi:putative hydrolase of the HAD superfamily
MSQRTQLPRVVFFDVGMTLLHTDPGIAQIYQEEACAIGAPVTVPAMQGAIEQTWRHFALPYFLHSRSRVTSQAEEDELWRELNRRVASALQMTIPTATFAERVEGRLADPSTWKLYADARPTLDRLAALGVRLGVISNWDGRLRHILHEHDLVRPFEHIQISVETGYRKPHPVIFLRALRAMGVPPSAAWHVGDNEFDDVHGATSLGVRAFHIDRAGRSTSPTSGEQVRSLLELVERVA